MVELLTGFSDVYIAVNLEESAVNVHEIFVRWCIIIVSSSSAVKQCSGAWRD